MKYEVSDASAQRCLECGKEIVYGRSDKRFCCETCKNTFHNRRTQKSNGYKLRVANALDKNYRILYGLWHSGKTSADLGDLVQWGFRAEYCTGYQKTRGHDEYRCYDIKYFKSAGRIFGIAKVETCRY